MTSDCIINHWLLDIASASLIHQESGEQRRLGEYQLKLLVVLIQHAGQILSREELNQLVWERRVIGSNSLPNAIHALRVALEDDGKQQLIIRTVPKKGYILEAEFCHFQRRINEEDEEDSDLQLLSMTPPSPPPAAPPELPTEAAPVIAVAEVPPAAPITSAPPAAKSHHLWMALFGITLVIFIALAVGIWRSSLQQQPYLAQLPLEGASQIRLLQLTNTSRDASTRQKDISELLGNTLRQLNTTLQQRATHMDIYYSASSDVINLTLNLKSACTHQQLVMTVFNAEDNQQALSKLLTEEMERKLNEMASCNP